MQRIGLRRNLRLSTALLAAAALLSVACGDSYEDRMAREHAGETPDATPAAGESPVLRVSTENVVYANVDGQEISGYLARPEGVEEELPGILVIHEWWGLNDNIRSMADQLAGQGYLALAVDLYGGQAADNADDARALATAARQNSAAGEENLRQAMLYLADELGSPRLGTVGWCFGGGWSLQAALLEPDLVDATVIYYGRVITEREALASLQTPILGIFGELDQGIPLDGVRQFESALEELGKEAAIHVYEGADHAFANPSGQRYNAAAATDAWQKTLEFFALHLQPEKNDATPEDITIPESYDDEAEA